jgi:hypothetical protein
LIGSFIASYLYSGTHWNILTTLIYTVEQPGKPYLRRGVLSESVDRSVEWIDRKGWFLHESGEAVE